SPPHRIAIRANWDSVRAHLLGRPGEARPLRRAVFMRKSIIAVALIVFLAPVAALPQQKSGKSGVYEQLNLFGEAFERIRHDAVEPVGDTKLIETAIAGMLAGLGPHSVYLNETEYKALQSPASEE